MLQINLNDKYNGKHCFSDLPQRFNGTDCGFPISQDNLDQFLAEPTLSMCGDDQLQANFEELHSQGNFTTPLNWETGVENYITLKNIAEI